MCNHIMVKVNDLNVCVKCGLILANGEKIILDRKLSNYIRRNAKRKRRKQK